MAIQAPPLEGWLTLSQLADRIGYTRQGVNYLAERGKIRTLRSVGDGIVYIMREAEIADVAAQLSKTPEERSRAHGGQDSTRPQAQEAQGGQEVR
jgi:hypothetical protein